MARSEGKIYIGNLPPDVKESDVEDIFYKFGKILAINLKTPPGQPPFAFVEFDDPRDAEDAIHDRDGYNYDGYALKVEHPRGGKGGGMGGGRFGYRDDFDARGRNGRSQGVLRRSDYRVLISGLPKSGSWQDLKDHMREAGDVCFADVFNDGTGVVEFVRLDDMKYAARKLDDSKFKSHEGETSHIRVREEYKNKGSRSRSVSRSRSRSYSGGRRRRRSYSNSISNR